VVQHHAIQVRASHLACITACHVRCGSESRIDLGLTLARFDEVKEHTTKEAAKATNEIKAHIDARDR
jgi:hypothetical protein